MKNYKNYKNYIKVSKEDFISILGFRDTEINKRMINALVDNDFIVKDSNKQELDDFMKQKDYVGNDKIFNQLNKILDEAVNDK